MWPVAKHHGVRVQTLTWWRWKLKRERAIMVRRPKLLPVVVATEPVVSTRAPQLLELAIRDVRVRLEAGTDVRYVAALVGAVREC